MSGTERLFMSLRPAAFRCLPGMRTHASRATQDNV
jgi:hypothetical protein